MVVNGRNVLLPLELLSSNFIDVRFLFYIFIFLSLGYCVVAVYSTFFYSHNCSYFSLGGYVVKLRKLMSHDTFAMFNFIHINNYCCSNILL